MIVEDITCISIHKLDQLYKIDKDENGQDILKPQVVLSGFDKGFDKDEQKTIILVKANMLIYMSGMIKEHSDINGARSLVLIISIKVHTGR